jgi:hypothetical protein
MNYETCKEEPAWGTPGVILARWEFLVMLRDHGRVQAERWLDGNFDRLGSGSTIDLGELFG